jgi:trans-aconitate methyltransferase
MADEVTPGIWTAYYQALTGRAPRELLLRALARWAAAPAGVARRAIDRGCGDGTETVALLQQGWHVLAVDSQPEAITTLRARVPPEHAARLATSVATFEQAVLPPVDFIYAGLSLFFCAPEHFPTAWTHIRAALLPGGRFAGHFLGDRDAWAARPTCTALTTDQVGQLFQGFDTEFFQELDYDGSSFSGPKHWHVFEVIARKPAEEPRVSTTEGILST